ncbi:ribonuclease P protein component [Enteractinococcus coprophilus]|uniref:Ribonuclease P protein component n=1 Tax=Enteractinococcus coprophilus TaxID=1027633 RepID=A0A543ANR1_9MICC|nr:ribonuclease P protein component [Enteractinococcus coprophilus]TQL74220.1 ribonuclease P protein component [Enteractinococcus coprophilus]
MLPKHQRIRTAAQFFETQRSGSRFGNRNVVVSANIRFSADDAPRAGFIVSKAVGNAVTRNSVKRRLRAIVTELFNRDLGVDLPGGSVDLVVRALPASAQLDFDELQESTTHAVHGALRKFMRRGQ